MNNHDAQRESLSVHHCGATPRSVLGRSLLGEYLSLALMTHAGIGSIAWGACSVRDPTALLFVAGSLWIVGRAAGAFAQRAFAPLITAGLIIAAWAFQQQELQLPVPAVAIFSSPVIIAMLGVVLFLDVVELGMSPLAAAAGRRLRSWNWHRIAVWAFASVFVIYMVVIPTVGWVTAKVHPPKSGRVVENMSLADQVRLRSMEAMTAVWFFALGATVGSFLNVVAYRMPRGESVVFRRSRCPRCRTPIKGRDNVPILGWLLLDGRCRACQTAISFRYPIVESVTAAIFLLLYFVELISGGANIPLRQPNLYHGVVWIIFYTKWDLVALYLFHCFSLSALLAWTLIDVDRQRIPWRARCLVGVILCVLPSLWSDLLPVPWLRRVAFGFDAPEWLSVMGTTMIGGLSGTLLGWLAARAIHFRVQHKALDGEESGERLPGGHTASAGMIVGLSVGWQAAVGVWLMAMAIRPIALGVTRRWNLSEPPMTAILLVAYVIHLMSWRWLTTDWWPSHSTTPIFWAVASVGFVSLWLFNRFLSGPREPGDNSGGNSETAAMTTGLPFSNSATSSPWTSKEPF